MPEAPTIVPPAPSARPAAAGAPSAVPASSGEIHVTPPGTKPTATPEPKPESAKGRLFKSLEDKAGGRPGAQPTQRPGAPAAPAAKPGEAPAEAVKPGEQPAPKPGEQPAAEAVKPGEQPTPDPKDGKKPSPWKMVDEYKGKLSKAEARIKELETSVLPENDRKAFEERVTKAEARAKQLEEHMAFTDYSQTEEFKTKYVEPYTKAWGVAMAELKDIKVDDGQGGQRDVTANDLLTIVNSPLAKARQIADEFFGPFANDIMVHRNEIRGLYDKQQAALEDAKKNGMTKRQQEAEAQQKAMGELSKTISTTWQQENEAVLKDEKYGALFKPREGDEGWNLRLQKGYELVDKAFSQNPADPKLTPEERASVIRRHAAVRNRAAAWGALRGEVESLTAANKALTEELAQYKGTEPPGGTGRTPNSPTPQGGGNAKSSMMEALRKKAR
jgi:hypothetical protein